MKQIILCSLLIGLVLQACSQTKKGLPPEYSLDGTVNSLYEVISGEIGEKRDWKLFKSLFAEGARMVPLHQKPEVGAIATYLNPQDYIDRSSQWLLENGFFEIEIHRQIDQFGDMAHVFSTYEAYHSMSDEQPFLKGINSIQMYRDKERWKILNMTWLQESVDNPIPDQYLPRP